MKLTKESSKEQIKQYFEEIARLYDSGESFPSDLDEVWPLVYSRKDKAVSSLLDNFVKDVDYKVFHQPGENSKGGRPSENYKLSVSCLEFFIARKVREVFEIYRQVFHAARKGELQPRTKEERWLETMQELYGTVQEQRKIIEKQAPKVRYTEEVIQSKNTWNIQTIAKELNMTAIELNRKLHEMGIQFKQDNHWVLYKEYQGKGYTTTETHVYEKSNGEKGTDIRMKWTERGRALIHLLLNPDMMNNNSEYEGRAI